MLDNINMPSNDYCSTRQSWTENHKFIPEENVPLIAKLRRCSHTASNNELNTSEHCNLERIPNRAQCSQFPITFPASHFIFDSCVCVWVEPTGKLGPSSMADVHNMPTCRHHHRPSGGISRALRHTSDFNKYMF